MSMSRWPFACLAPVLSLGLAGCGAPPDEPEEAAGEVATDTFLLRLPSRGQMDALAGELRRRGMTVQHVYSELVGLAGTVAVRARAADVQDLLRDLPMPIEARAAVYRHPDLLCGDGTCQPEEAQTQTRSSTCSYDCGVPPPRPLRDELDNAWHVRLVGADRVWGQTRGEGVHVAVLDTGWDRGAASTHPDLPEHMGFGYNFAAGTPDYSALTDHGTHVAGIIAAPRNGYGTAGVAPGATIHPFQVFRRVGGRVVAADSDIIAAIEMAIRNGYHILNLSLGGGRDSELEHLALRKAYDAGLLSVAAAGNSEDYAAGHVLTAPRHFPGAYPESLSVGATSRSDAIASFSATGHTVVLSAPGVSVYSTVLQGMGEPLTTAVFDISGIGMRQLHATIPFGSSVTPLRGAQVVACGFGSLAEVDRCAPAARVALIQRGPIGEGVMAIPFAQKIENARSRGALGVILYNHRGGDPAVAGGLFGADIGTAQPVPVVVLAAGDGERLAALIQSGAEVRMSVTTTFGDFAGMSGTSMATPVVAGVAALVWARHPGLTNVELRQLLAESAVDLGAPGRDDMYGWGRVDVVRALAQGRPRARCGDGRLDRASEICEGDLVPDKGCEDFGWDETPQGRLTCNRQCTSVDATRCACLPGRAPFEVSMDLVQNHSQGGQRGTLAIYRVRLASRPVRGASARVTVRRGGALAYTYEVGPSNAQGEISDFTPYERTGMTPGTYEFFPVITKGGGRCHDDQPMMPVSYTVDIKN